jgi:hypothetical protein
VWDRFAFTLNGDTGYGWSMDAAASTQQWSVVYDGGTGPAFNKENANRWKRELCVTINNLSFYGDTWCKHARQKPVMMAAGTYPYTFAFSV